MQESELQAPAMEKQKFPENDSSLASDYRKTWLGN